jgi:para-aminobenzoate synthetase/4-amino-4-deoxychorismate lyase
MTDHVFLDDQGSGEQFVFRAPHRIISAETRGELPAAFAAIEKAQAEGFWLAGWMSYELGHALEPALDAPASAPLLQFGVFDAPEDNVPADWLYTRDVPRLKFQPDWSAADYLKRFEAVQDYLRAGDCYQVNLTFPMQAEIKASDVSPHQLYAAFRRRQPGRYGAVVQLGDTQIVSFSPELFFAREGQQMRMRPMKGTRPRGAEDARILAEMQAEPKSRAENLMIVDLLRNDLSRLCEPGSVAVPELFALETYPTLHQMTSEVTGTLRDGLIWEEILRGLFPCGSITGAPKLRTMEIIQELESGPRGAYCGAVGYIAPDNRAQFSVAIRTVQMQGDHLRYDVGSGVVLDSDGPDEYRECLLKARIFDPQPEGVIETFRQMADGKIPRQNYHRNRFTLASGFDWPEVEADGIDSRVRVVGTRESLSIERAPYTPLETPLKLALSGYALFPSVQDFGVKTTARDFYDGERARLVAKLGIDEVIFFNEAQQLCEGSFTSLFLKIDGQLFTPHISAGLLPGVLRAEMLDTGQAKAAHLTRDDLSQAEAVFVGNSLRGLMPAMFIDKTRH